MILQDSMNSTFGVVTHHDARLSAFPVFLFHQAFEVVAEFLAAEVGGKHSPHTSCTSRDLNCKALPFF